MNEGLLMNVTKRRYTIRKIGNKHDYIRRYGVYDLTTGRRVDGVLGGLERDGAQEIADDMNGIPCEDRD